MAWEIGSFLGRGMKWKMNITPRHGRSGWSENKWEKITDAVRRNIDDRMYSSWWAELCRTRQFRIVENKWQCGWHLYMSSRNWLDTRTVFNRSFSLETGSSARTTASEIGSRRPSHWFCPAARTTVTLLWSSFSSKPCWRRRCSHRVSIERLLIYLSTENIPFIEQTLLSIVGADKLSEWNAWQSRQILSTDWMNGTWLYLSIGNRDL